MIFNGNFLSNMGIRNFCLGMKLELSSDSLNGCSVLIQETLVVLHSERSIIFIGIMKHNFIVSTSVLPVNGLVLNI